MIAAATLVFHLLGVVSAIHAVMTVRTEQGSIAWASLAFQNNLNLQHGRGSA